MTGATLYRAASAMLPADDMLWTEQPQREWHDVFREIEELHDLQDDWDGDDAIAPPGDVVDDTMMLAKALRERRCPPPFVRATPDGAVCLAWDLDPDQIEIEISDEGAEFVQTRDYDVVQQFIL